ncbi:MAG: hypothetical protein VX589_15445 [Myxococcota bacterium]|nr:hypothetical protein [Myxococcota bacterium]
MSEVTELTEHQGGFAFTCQVCQQLNPVSLGATTPQDTAHPPVEPNSPPAPAHPQTAQTDDLESTVHEHPPSFQRCPKCSYENALTAKACHRCGLNFAFASASGRNFQDDGLTGNPQAEHIRTVWADVAQRPEDQEAHEAFIQICTTLNALEYAGARYRTLADENPESEYIANYRNRVIQAALARSVRLDARVRSGLSDRMRSLLVLCFGALLLLAFAFGYYLLTGNQAFWQDY